MMVSKGNLVKNKLHDRIKQIEAEQGIKFSNTQKVLLTIEGSITAILDVLYGTVSIFLLRRHFEPADSETAAFLDVEEGEEIHYREVLIHGRGKPMIYALSYIALNRCKEEAHDDLVNGEIPIGKLLKKYEVESRREIRDIYIEKPNATLRELFKTDEDFVSRDYIIIQNKQIIMRTKESFPISYFTEEMV